jgi:hypothetical protein
MSKIGVLIPGRPTCQSGSCLRAVLNIWGNLSEWRVVLASWSQSK